MAAGLAAAIAVAGYRYARRHGGAPFLQARYLLPLLPLYALFPALAVRALGAALRRSPRRAAWSRRRRRTALFAQLLTLARFYG